MDSPRRHTGQPMSIIEHRQGIELRADGRTLVGAAVRYGDVSPSHRERFEPGSLTVSPDLAPCLGHRTGRVLAYGQDVQVEDRADALIVSAHLPRTAAAATGAGASSFKPGAKPATRKASGLSRPRTCPVSPW